MSNELQISGQNQAVENWSRAVQSRLKTSASKFSGGKSTNSVVRQSTGGFVSRREKKLAQSIARKIHKRYGLSEGISFRFERHGVFVVKGVGRGYKMQGGQVTRYAKSAPEKLRQPNDWFNVVIDRDIEVLADKIAEINADASINANKIRIR